MPLTPAEKQKAYRERKKARQKAAQEGTAPYLETPFSELWNESAGFTDFEQALQLAGIEPPSFEDERNPEDVTLEAEAIGIDQYGVDAIYGNRKGAIGRAEVIIGSLIDAAVELSSIVNRYKRTEIETRLAELENSDETDVATAMEQAVKLNKLLDQLNKQVRRSFPQWEVTSV
ncbi:hypothetical protein [Ruegeria sp. HKCCD6157]|uniref:hypothetical protein n=1 Tax=Ruegeria sp. HKCCD6157 TaxID=2690707 RepID=UPI001490DF7A|nr:hypothetical protein [Ruegeria sp. HKCCD6157]NOE24828.1 hypothetical protein [Ruegeria sp. HKCCD6157]